MSASNIFVQGGADNQVKYSRVKVEDFVVDIQGIKREKKKKKRKKKNVEFDYRTCTCKQYLREMLFFLFDIVFQAERA